MRKRVAKKILKNKDKLVYSKNQLEKAEAKKAEQKKSQQ